MEGFIYVVKFYYSDDEALNDAMITTSAENAVRLLLCRMIDGETAYSDFDYEKSVEYYVGDSVKWTKDVIDSLNTYHIYTTDDWCIRAIPVTTTEEIEGCEENLKNGYSMYDALI